MSPFNPENFTVERGEIVPPVEPIAVTRKGWPIPAPEAASVMGVNRVHLDRVLNRKTQSKRVLKAYRALCASRGLTV